MSACARKEERKQEGKWSREEWRGGEEGRGWVGGGMSREIVTGGV
jgi:hypothetical protein